jgi:asparagine synthase (glutamine-hydrolysing)
MCGIAGFLTSRNLTAKDEVILRAMTDAIANRGPDDSGVWVDRSKRVALGHRRLAIVDLSPAGHQPMASASERYVLVYNGEIYNHIDLRNELEAARIGQAWRGNSDTEVLLAAFDRWGLPGALTRVNGMFALAVWDRVTQTLTLARDRMGEKPLFYGRAGEAFLFGSELKALTSHPDFERSVSKDALALYLRYNYVPSPHCIWNGVRKLLPGHYIEIRDQGRVIGEPVSFWDFQQIASKGASRPLEDTPELVDDLETLLMDAVGRQMGADVPLGAFLSGGIDSSLIVSLMQAQSHKQVQTFTIGFNELEYNEAEHAKAVANHLGTRHTELYVSAADALAVVPGLATIWDEPFSDSSQIPTYLVSAMTRQHVTVSLSGDGGDELFGGYNRYNAGMRLWRGGQRVPRGLRRAVAAAAVNSGGLAAVNAAVRLLPGRIRPLGLADRLHKVGDLLSEDTVEGVYRRLTSSGTDPDNILQGGWQESADGPAPSNWPDVRQFMMYTDARTYLPDDVLVKVDRASMAVSLEARAPFLDHRVVEYAWRLPMSAKIRGGVGKYILREVLARHVPRNLTDRPKMGFAIPVGQWLRGPLRSWAQDLLEEDRVARDGFFRPAAVSELWRDYLGGKPGLQARLWSILMFQAWWVEHQRGHVRANVSEGPRT